MIDEKRLELLDYQIHNGDYGFADLTQAQQAELVRLARLGLIREQEAKLQIAASAIHQCVMAYEALAALPNVNP